LSHVRGVEEKRKKRREWNALAKRPLLLRPGSLEFDVHAVHGIESWPAVAAKADVRYRVREAN
jgi:hypothetical protein